MAKEQRGLQLPRQVIGMAEMKAKMLTVSFNEYIELLIRKDFDSDIKKADK
jgi:hypothetical protein